MEAFLESAIQMRPMSPADDGQPGGADLAALDGIEEVTCSLHVARYHDRSNIGNGFGLQGRDYLPGFQFV